MSLEGGNRSLLLIAERLVAGIVLSMEKVP